MKITYEPTYYNGPALVVNIYVKTAIDYDTIFNKLLDHTEYTTEWANKCDEWILEKKYFKRCSNGKLKGSEDVMFVVHFIDVDKELIKEFISECNKYFEEYPSDYINLISSSAIKDINY